MKTAIVTALGKKIKLSAAEYAHAQAVQADYERIHGPRLKNSGRVKNSLGYEVQITTLTAISKDVSEQKFYEIAPAEYIPVIVGEGAWNTNLTTFRSFDAAGGFADGIVNTAGQTSRLASADAGVDALNIKILNWAKSLEYSIMDLEFAARQGNWDLVSAKEKARKRNWDLGIQHTAFLGLPGSNGECLGLLNQPAVNVNTSLITKPLSVMTPAELKTFQAAVLNEYRENNQRTAWPDRFVIPESDYLGLASQASDDFPIKSTLQLLEEAFKTTTRNDGFKILPLAYGDAAYHADVSAIAGKQCYALYRYDEESMKMTIPVDYTNTLANSVNNFQFQNVGYGQFTGLQMLRPLETLYFQYAA